LARLVFSNVPTATGGVISGNISVGAGSPFGSGGQYSSQVRDIKQTIAQAPEGFYAPVGWDKFLKKEELYAEQLGQDVRFARPDDPEITDALMNIPSARNAMINLNGMRLGYGGRTWEACPKCSQAQHNEIAKQRDQYQDIIGFHVNQLMMEKNAPLIQAIELQERQLEIDTAVKLALEQKIRKTATPTPEPTPTPSDVIIDSIYPVSYLPFAVVGIVLIVILLFLRRRA